MEPPENFDELLRSIPGLHARNSQPGEAFFANLPERTRHLDQQFLHILLDNLGLVAAEQVVDQPWQATFEANLKYFARRWQLGKGLAVDHFYWRVPSVFGVVRMLPANWDMAWPHEGLASLEVPPDAPTTLEDFRAPEFWSWRKRSYQDWDELDWDRLVPPTLFKSQQQTEWLFPLPHGPVDWTPTYGAHLPDALRPERFKFTLLAPSHATPDLPRCVGAQPDQLRLYQEVLLH